jgi:hypothetical protein
MIMTKKQDGKDKSKAPGATTELNEAELEKATGGSGSRIGSSTGGAGAGKVEFDQFSITRKNDTPTPL